MDQLLSGQFHNSAAMIWSFAIKTSGVFGPVASTILRDLAHQIKDVSKQPHSRTYLFQRISVVVQRGNASSVMECAGLDLDAV